MVLLFGVLESPERMRVESQVYQYDNLSLEEKAKGIEVEFVPEMPEYQKGKGYQLYINPQTKEMWYETYDRPLTPDEQAAEQNEKLDIILQMLLEKEGIL